MTALWAWLDAVLLFAVMLASGFVVTLVWGRGLQQTLSALGRALSAIDGFLVHRLTWAFGTRWVKGPFAWFRRWSHLAAAFAALSLAGALLPLPFAVGCLALGFFGVLAIIRQWVWDEEDRAQDVPDQFRRVPGGEDLVNEAMFAGACIFLLTPILFFRLDQAFGLFSTPANLGLFAYAAYTFGEFLKAVPLLDYSEVYGLQNLSGVSATSLVGRHATFAFRVLLDLALISGLIQVIAVTQRIASGRDIRKLQAALESNDGEAIDAAIARLTELGLRNQANAQRALIRVLDARDASLNPWFDVRRRFRAASALLRIAEHLADTPLFLTVINAYQALLHTLPADTPDWAATQNNLGNALHKLGARLGGAAGAARLSEAVVAIRAALRVHTEAAMPTDWAMTQENLGHMLCTLGARLGGAEGAAQLEAAVAAYRAALRVRTEAAMPADWAMTQNDLGAALLTLGARLGGAQGAARLEEAVAALCAALRVHTETAMPVQWAMTQHNLGNALCRLGELLGGSQGASRLEEAVAPYRAALRVRTEKVMPAQWAMTQNNLGNTLHSLGELLGGSQGATRLEEAVVALRAALRVHTEAAMPADWAMTQNNLGNALRALGEHLGGADGATRLAEALAAYGAALHIYTEATMPADWAMTQNNLGNALWRLGERLGGAQGAARLEQAVAAYGLALRVQTETAMPAQWAMTQHNMGTALCTLGELLGGAQGATRLEEAVAAYVAALRVRAESVMPAGWAMTQNGMGNALCALGELLGGAQGCIRLRDAIAAYQGAVRVFGTMQATHYEEMARANLARADALFAERCTEAR